MTTDDHENGNSLKIPGWFVRLNLILVPFVIAPLFSWLIWTELSNKDRIQSLEAQVRSQDAELRAESDEQRRRTERVYPQ